MAHQERFGVLEYLPTDQRGFEAGLRREGRLVRGRRSLARQWSLCCHEQFLEDLESLPTAPWGVCGGLAAGQVRVDVCTGTSQH